MQAQVWRCNCYLPTLCALYFDVWGGSCADIQIQVIVDSGEQIRALNEHSRSLKFYNHREGPYYGLLLVKSSYYRFHI